MMSCKYEMLSSRQLFNDNVRHVKATIAIVERVQSGDNLADVLNDMVERKEIANQQILSFVSMILTDKLGYITSSHNLVSVEADLSLIHEQVKKWNAADLVLVYHHPDLGVLCINPKNPLHFALLDRLNKYEVITAYAGNFGKAVDSPLCKKAVDALIELCEGRQVKIDPSLLKGACAYRVKADKTAKTAKTAAVKKVAPKAAAAKGGKQPASGSANQLAPAVSAAPAVAPAPVARAAHRMTPMYAVPVTNELFHNGNVEAWKRIIDSYKAKHTKLEVLVYYDGERITNLNALFKWGKVKHGSTIQFAVAGEDIKDVAKLQRYLTQGASNMFEAFLRGPVNGVLSLF